MLKELLVSASDRETRIAVLEEGRVAEVQIERRKQRGTVGNIYKGRVTRVLPGMQSAFVDVGLEKDAFLYVADVGEEVDDFDAFGSGGAAEAIAAVAAVVSALPHDAAASPASETGSAVPDESIPKPVLPSIDELLREGQELVVQVTKDQIAHKGVRVTTHVTLPGRTLVYMPTIDHVGVSRRIENEDERRPAQGHPRPRSRRAPAATSSARRARDARPRSSRPTAATSRSSGSRSARRASAPARPTLLHRDLDLTLRAARDVFGSDFATLWVDDDEEYQRIVEFLDQVQPALVSKVKLYRKSTPLFEEYGVESEIENALKSKVWLKSGGYIVINQTEALVAIDVNTGKFVGQEAARGDGREDEPRGRPGDRPADPPARSRRPPRRRLHRHGGGGAPAGRSCTALETEMKKDRSKNRMLPVSEFGLVEITRKRQRQSLERALTMPCPYCAGSGRTKSVPTIVLEIRREIPSGSRRGRRTRSCSASTPRSTASLVGEERRLVEELEERIGMPIHVQSDEHLHHERFDIVLEA